MRVVVDPRLEEQFRTMTEKQGQSIRNKIAQLTKRFKKNKINLANFYQYFDKVCEPLETKSTCGSWADCSMCCNQNVNISKAEYDFMDTSRVSQDIAPMDNDFRKKAKIPCQLLQDGKCTTYNKRPIGCRMYLTTDSPSKCASFDMEILATLDMLIAVSAWRTYAKDRQLKNIEEWATTSNRKVG